MNAVTDMTPSSVVEVTPTAVTGVMSFMSSPDGPSIKRVILRSEALSAKAYDRDRVLSQTSDIQIDCRSRKARLGRAMAYAARSLIGDGREVRAASPVWVRPVEHSAEYNAILRICADEAANPLFAEQGNFALASATMSPAAPTESRASSAAPEAAAAHSKLEAHSAFKASDALAREPMVSLNAVQLAASSSQLRAEQLLAAIQQQAALPVGATPRVAKVLVSGKTYYRALLVGFATRDDASEYCREVVNSGGDCFVRKLPSG